MPFRTSIPVRFGDVDHAGIVYYPHFFIYFHEAFEDMFNETGLSYVRMLDELKLGFPTVHIETDYKAPLRYGDRLDLDLSVPRIGRRSATLRYVGHRARDGALCVTCDLVCACVDMKSFKAADIPDEIRAMFTRYAA